MSAYKIKNIPSLVIDDLEEEYSYIRKKKRVKQKGERPKVRKMKEGK